MTNRHYSRREKLQIVKQSYKEKRISSYARKLGIPPSNIYKWRRLYERDGEENCFKGKGGRKSSGAKRIYGVEVYLNQKEYQKFFSTHFAHNKNDSISSVVRKLLLGQESLHTSCKNFGSKEVDLIVTERAKWLIITSMT